MKQNLMLPIASLLLILLMTLHLTSDTTHARAGTPEAGGSTLVGVPVLAVWLCGTLLLAERRSGLIIMLVGSLIAIGMPVRAEFVDYDEELSLPVFVPAPGKGA